jgi:hypothetical protein
MTKASAKEGWSADGSILLGRLGASVLLVRAIIAYELNPAAG